MSCVHSDESYGMWLRRDDAVHNTDMIRSTVVLMVAAPIGSFSFIATSAMEWKSGILIIFKKSLSADSMVLHSCRVGSARALHLLGRQVRNRNQLIPFLIPTYKKNGEAFALSIFFLRLLLPFFVA